MNKYPIKNQKSGSHDTCLAGLSSCELSTLKESLEMIIQEDDDIITSTDKFVAKNSYIEEKDIICYARNCNKIATANLTLRVSSKTISIYTCDDCKSKFE